MAAKNTTGKSNKASFHDRDLKLLWGYAAARCSRCRCDLIAEGIISAVRDVKVAVPVVVRLEGTNVDQGRKMLKDSGLAITAADDLTDAARKAVESVGDQP